MEIKTVRLKKTLAILLIVLFVASMSAVAVSASHGDHQKRGHHHQNDRHHGDKIKTNSEDYKSGYSDGKVAGYNDGKADYTATTQKAYQESYDDSLTSIPIAVKQKNNYIAGYEAGYEKGYDKGYP